MYRKSFSAMFSAVRMLFKSRRVLALMLAAYAALIAAIFLFVSTREATISQLLLTLFVVVAVPVLFFVLQALSVSYVDGPSPVGFIRKLASDSVKLLVVSLPLIALTIVGVFGLNKVQSHITTATTLRYLLVAVIAPLLAIQLWTAAKNSGLIPSFRNVRSIVRNTLAPQSVFTYACGFIIFAIIPYFIMETPIPTPKPWLEMGMLVLRLGVSAILILLGWALTVGAISILNRTK